MYLRATVSRLATGKYLEYNGKLYEFKKFFSNQVSNTSKDKIILEIKKIIQEAVDSKKQLSDQKISEILLERGIKISRRTVSKYRNIENNLQIPNDFWKKQKVFVQIVSA